MIGVQEALGSELSFEGRRCFKAGVQSIDSNRMRSVDCFDWSSVSLLGIFILIARLSISNLLTLSSCGIKTL